MHYLTKNNLCYRLSPTSCSPKLDELLPYLSLGQVGLLPQQLDVPGIHARGYTLGGGVVITHAQLNSNWSRCATTYNYSLYGNNLHFTTAFL